MPNGKSRRSNYYSLLTANRLQDQNRTAVVDADLLTDLDATEDRILARNHDRVIGGRLLTSPLAADPTTRTASLGGALDFRTILLTATLLGVGRGSLGEERRGWWGGLRSGRLVVDGVGVDDVLVLVLVLVLGWLVVHGIGIDDVLTLGRLVVHDIGVNDVLVLGRLALWGQGGTSWHRLGGWHLSRRVDMQAVRLAHDAVLFLPLWVVLVWAPRAIHRMSKKIEIERWNGLLHVLKTRNDLGVELTGRLEREVLPRDDSIAVVLDWGLKSLVRMIDLETSILEAYG